MDIITCVIFEQVDYLRAIGITLISGLNAEVRFVLYHTESVFLIPRRVRYDEAVSVTFGVPSFPDDRTQSQSCGPRDL